MKYSFDFILSFMIRSFLNDLNKQMPTFVWLKQNSAVEIISSKNSWRMMIWIVIKTTTKTSVWLMSRLHQDNRQKFIVLSFCLCGVCWSSNQQYITAQLIRACSYDPAGLLCRCHSGCGSPGRFGPPVQIS